MAAEIGAARRWAQILAPRGAAGAGHVRALVEADLPGVVKLYEKIFGARGHFGAASYLAQVFCHHPWHGGSLSSLVYQDAAGRILGVLGILPRPMWLRKRPVLAAISHHFMVEPSVRPALVAVELAKAFLSGPQDLSLAEGSDESRKIWEGLGGSLSLAHSLSWTRVLRPSRYVLSFLRRRGLPPALGAALRPICRLADSLIPWIPQRPFHVSSPRASGEPLSAEALLSCVEETSGRRSLRPQYDEDSLKWLLDVLAQKQGRGTLERVLVRGATGKIIGWYLCYHKPSGVAEVIQLGATPEVARDVLEHLLHRAWRWGAVAVSGYLDPAFFPALSETHCVFHHGGSWMLIHSRDPEILGALHRGDAFLTRLEGEWWIAA